MCERISRNTKRRLPVKRKVHPELRPGMDCMGVEKNSQDSVVNRMWSQAGFGLERWVEMEP